MYTVEVVGVKDDGTCEQCGEKVLVGYCAVACMRCNTPMELKPLPEGPPPSIPKDGPPEVGDWCEGHYYWTCRCYTANCAYIEKCAACGTVRPGL